MNYSNDMHRNTKVSSWRHIPILSDNFYPHITTMVDCDISNSSYSPTCKDDTVNLSLTWHGCIRSWKVVYGFTTIQQSAQLRYKNSKLRAVLYKNINRIAVILQHAVLEIQANTCVAGSLAANELFQLVIIFEKISQELLPSRLHNRSFERLLNNCIDQLCPIVLASSDSEFENAVLENPTILVVLCMLANALIETNSFSPRLCLQIMQFSQRLSVCATLEWTSKNEGIIMTLALRILSTFCHRRDVVMCILAYFLQLDRSHRLNCSVYCEGPEFCSIVKKLLGFHYMNQDIVVSIGNILKRFSQRGNAEFYPLDIYDRLFAVLRRWVHTTTVVSMSGYYQLMASLAYAGASRWQCVAHNYVVLIEEALQRSLVSGEAVSSRRNDRPILLSVAALSQNRSHTQNGGIDFNAERDNLLTVLLIARACCSLLMMLPTTYDTEPEGRRAWESANMDNYWWVQNTG